MKKTINPKRLKAAAEHLEWVLRQYSDSQDVQTMLHGLNPLIEDAKAERVKEPIERIPFEYNFADGIYAPYKNPSVGGAYADFSTEMRGGVTKEESEILMKMESYQNEINNGGRA